MTFQESLVCPLRDRSVNVFTLIELLVVISIVSVLISLLLPALASARDNARLVQCASNQRGIGLAVNLYAEDSKDYYPSAIIATGTWSKYIGVKYLNVNFPGAWNLGERPPSIFACPSSDRLIVGGINAHYGLNFKVSSDHSSLRRADIISAEQIVFSTDGVARGLLPWSTNPTVLAMEGRHKRGVASTDLSNIINALYCDGHVATSPMGDLVAGNYLDAFKKRPWAP